MKPFYKLLTLIALFTLQSSVVLSQDCFPDDPTCNGELPQPGQGLGASTPIDDYAGLLIITGVMAAGIIYSNKEKMILKK